MLSKKIEFYTNDHYFDLKEDFPVPIKTNIPDWFKKLTHSPDNRTIKGCMPFLDTLITGYLLKNPTEFRLKHNVLNPQTGKKDSFYTAGTIHDNIIQGIALNINQSVPNLHPPEQLKGSSLIEKNKNFPMYKIMNPWIIKTPPGYSCLFVPPLNNSDDRFSIIPGIVDTDTFNQEINFPFVVNGDKYESIETIIKKGTPYVQIIPFKRDSWEMSIEKIDSRELRKRRISFGLRMFNIYKNFFWRKKSWK